MANSSANGAAYLILDSLASGSKYGLEIIEHISTRTGGHVIMKKPTLYSALTRMEKKGLVSSSYWQTSDMGGKRHYYTITNAGKKELDSLEVEFKNASFDDFDEETPANKEESLAPSTEKPIVGWQDNMFNLTEQPKAEKASQPKADDVIENQMDLFSFQAEQNSSATPANNPDTAFSSNNFDSNNFDAAASANNFNAASDAVSSNSITSFNSNTARDFNASSEDSSDFNAEKAEKMEYYQSILQQQPAYLQPEPQNDTTNAAINNAANAPEDAQDDAVFLDRSEGLNVAQEKQNQAIYDSSQDLKRYRKRRSFAENQIEMSVEYEREEDLENQRKQIENLKNTLLNFRQNKNEQILDNFDSNVAQNGSDSSFANTASDNSGATLSGSNTQSQPQQASQQQWASFEQAQTQEQTQRNPVWSWQKQTQEQSAQNSATEDAQRIDDAVFVTSRVNEAEIPVQKKILPPNIEIGVADANLPAPKRNANLEPTYKDMMAKLYERKKEKEKTKLENSQSPSRSAQTSEELTNKHSSQDKVSQQSSARSSQTSSNGHAPAYQTSYESGNFNDLDSFADYATLRGYYAQRGIEFKEYAKASVVRTHNTNFLQFISSIVLLLLSGIGCSVIFGIIAGTHLLNPSSNFLFYTVPSLFLLYSVFMFVRYKIYASKKAALAYNAVTNWAVLILMLVVIVVINICCGMEYEFIKNFLTSLLVPSYAMLLAFPCNYYIKKFLYKHYGK